MPPSVPKTPQRVEKGTETVFTCAALEVTSIYP
jgi:hypothetical protein